MTPPQYTNSQNSMISFDYSWFLAKNLSTFVSLLWKLHNRYYHNMFWLVLSSFHFLQRYNSIKIVLGDRVFVKITTSMRSCNYILYSRTLFFSNNDKRAKFLHNFKISFSNLQFFKNHHQSYSLGIILNIAIFWEIELT